MDIRLLLKILGSLISIFEISESFTIVRYFNSGAAGKYSRSRRHKEIYNSAKQIVERGRKKGFYIILVVEVVVDVEQLLPRSA